VFGQVDLRKRGCPPPLKVQNFEPSVTALGTPKLLRVCVAEYLFCHIPPQVLSLDITKNGGN